MHFGLFTIYDIRFVVVVIFLYCCCCCRWL